MQETLITKEYWEPFFKHACRCFRNGRYEKLQGVPVYKMYWRKHLMYVAATSKGSVFEVIGWLYLRQQPGWQAWEIVQSYVFEAFRSQGWGKRLFRAVIEREGLMLASGYCQSRVARQLWKRLVASGRYTIWAHDFKNVHRFGPVAYDPENDALWSPLQVYDMMDTAEQDVRLIAIRNRT